MSYVDLYILICQLLYPLHNFCKQGFHNILKPSLIVLGWYFSSPSILDNKPSQLCFYGQPYQQQRAHESWDFRSCNLSAAAVTGCAGHPFKYKSHSCYLWDVLKYIDCNHLLHSVWLIAQKRSYKPSQVIKVTFCLKLDFFHLTLFLRSAILLPFCVPV